MGEKDDCPGQTARAGQVGRRVALRGSSPVNVCEAPGPEGRQPRGPSKDGSRVMTKPIDSVWELPDHSRVKHEILRAYLDRWMPILSSKFERVIFVDGFAGPGVYKNGEPGSPLIAINALMDFTTKMGLRIPMRFVFLEADGDRYLTLKAVTDELRLELPEYVQLFVENAPFEDEATGLLDNIGSGGSGHLAPSLWFIDPFGYTGFPMKLIRRISKHPSSEVFINFMSGYVNRFKTKEGQQNAMNQLFGRDVGDELQDVSIDGCVSMYRRELLQQTDFRYCLHFAIAQRQKQGESWYHMVFATKHPKGFEKMKEAMWKTDPDGGFRYRARDSESGQLLLFDGPDCEVLRRRLQSHFQGKCVRVEDLEAFVVEETLFLVKHLRKPVLDPLEAAGEIEVIGRTRKNSYKGCQIRFPTQPRRG